MTRLVKSLFFLLLLLATSASAQTTAAKANDFLKTLGVATHKVQSADASLTISRISAKNGRH
jgi:hypothetical protein